MAAHREVPESARYKSKPSLDRLEALSLFSGASAYLIGLVYLGQKGIDVFVEIPEQYADATLKLTGIAAAVALSSAGIGMAHKRVTELFDRHRAEPNQAPATLDAEEQVVHDRPHLYLIAADMDEAEPTDNDHTMATILPFRRAPAATMDTTEPSA